MKKIQNVEQVQVQQFDQRMRTFMECLVSPSLVVIAVGMWLSERGFKRVKKNVLIWHGTEIALIHRPRAVP